MSVVDQEQNFTKRPKGCVCWKMAWWVIGLMNHPILKDATNVGLLRTNTRAIWSPNVEWNSLKREYATVIRGNSIRQRKSFTLGTEAWGSNTTITTPTPDVRRRPRTNLHQVAQGIPSLVNGLVGEGLNEPLNSQGCNQCGIFTHK